ncbi:MAG: hypothetical protein HOV96_39095 [Nonomuraea sp.]|nr:hypothetical protein [Nonomuraea sp.]
MSHFTALSPATTDISQRGRTPCGALTGTFARLVAGVAVAAALTVAPLAGGAFTAGTAHNGTFGSTAGAAHGSGVVVAGGFEWGAPARR